MKNYPADLFEYNKNEIRKNAYLESVKNCFFPSNITEEMNKVQINIQQRKINYPKGQLAEVNKMCE